MDYRVEFSPETEEQLVALYNYLSEVASPQTALNYTEGIVTFCESLSQFPERGNCRDELLPGLRVTNWRKRTIIAFMVKDETVTVLGIWYGGQDFESALVPDRAAKSSGCLKS